jgi:hypothetical protein
MSPRLTVTKDNVAKILAALKGLGEHQVLVGIPSETTQRQPEPGEPADITNAVVGYLMENGAPAANIPARPFLKPGVASVEEEIADRYEAGAKAALEGRVANIDAVHHAVGLMAVSAVKAKITEGPFVPLAESTLAARRRRGKKSDKPLIDSGQLRAAVTSVVRPRPK